MWHYINIDAMMSPMPIRSGRDFFKKAVVKTLKTSFYATKLEQQILLSNKGQDWMHILLSRLISYFISTLVIRERNVCKRS